MTSASSEDLSATGVSAREHAFPFALLLFVFVVGVDDMASDFGVVLPVLS